MRLSSKLLNFEVGFFIVKKYSFRDIFRKHEDYQNNDYDQRTLDREIWELTFPLEKRIHALTGWNEVEKRFDEKGLMVWVFRDVATNALAMPKNAIFVINGILSLVLDWRKILMRAGATMKDIEVYDKVIYHYFNTTMTLIFQKNEFLANRIIIYYAHDKDHLVKEMFKKIKEGFKVDM